MLYCLVRIFTHKTCFACIVGYLQSKFYKRIKDLLIHQKKHKK